MKEWKQKKRKETGAHALHTTQCCTVAASDLMFVYSRLHQSLFYPNSLMRTHTLICTVSKNSPRLRQGEAVRSRKLTQAQQKLRFFNNFIYVWPLTPCLYVSICEAFDHSMVCTCVYTDQGQIVCNISPQRWERIPLLTFQSHTHTHTVWCKKKTTHLIAHCSLRKLNICGLIGTEFPRCMLRNIR